MARPTKQGIDYFPLDCQFDDKIEMYLIEKGAVGLGVLITVWQMIYSNHGYYIANNDDLHLLIKRKIDVDPNEVSECLNAAIGRNLFDLTLHDKYSILTSSAIQKRYFEAAKKKKTVSVCVDYVINGIDSGNNWVDVDGNATNVKVKEDVKVNVKNTSTRPKIPFQEILDSYHEILPTLPRVAKLTETRKGYIKRLWLEDELPAIKNWNNFFEYVGRSDFLMGKSMPGGDRRPFKASLEWITKPANYIKILEGNYHG